MFRTCQQIRSGCVTFSTAGEPDPYVFPYHRLSGLAPPEKQVMAMNSEIREAEMTIEQLDQVSGGDMLGMAINAAEKYMNGLLGRLINAVHQPPTTPSPK